MSDTENSLESFSTNAFVNNNIDNDKKEKIECLVIDSGPLIKGINVRSFSEKIYTIPEVISEIRDKHSRDFLNQISFDLQIKVPSNEALKEVVNFSKKTGDFTSLSAVDLRVLALTYMLEVEANGTKRLRKEPLKSCTKIGNKNSNKSPKKKPANKPESKEFVNKQEEQQRQVNESNLVSNLANINITVESSSPEMTDHQKNAIGNLHQVENSEHFQNNPGLAVDGNEDEQISVNVTEKNNNDDDDDSVNEKRNEISDVQEDDDDNDMNNVQNTPDLAVGGNEDEKILVNNTENNNSDDDSFDKKRNELSNVQDDDNNDTNNNEDEKILVNDTEKNNNDDDSINEKKNEISDVQEDDDDNDIEWITPDNIDDYQAKEQNFSEKYNLGNMKIACMTTDYSMQNVLLQMRLNLISIEGKRIKKVKNWVLRCHACFKITTNMEKKFCPNCGNATLIRTSTSTDANGNVTYYLKKNFQYNLRGTKYSIPESKGGRHANNIVLREDQKEYQKALKSQRKQKEIDIFDPDYIPSLLIGSRTSKSITPVIGYGRRNPNEARRGKTKGRKK